MRGFSLIEIVVSAGLLLLLSTLFVSAIVDAEAGTQIGGQRVRATFLANEGLEAARNVRDKSFALLVNGTFGIATTSNAWTLTGSSDTKDIFTRAITVTSLNAVTKQVTSTVTWPESPVRNGSVSVVTYLSNTQLLATQANSLLVNIAGANSGGNNNVDIGGITWRNIGSSTVTVAQIQTSWTNGASLTQVVVNGATVWTGTQASGNTQNITDVAIAAGATIPVTRYRFSASMSGATVTTIFTMLDGSTKTVTTGTL